MSALRRMRATDAEINFKPWIYQIARNAAIDSYRRNSHAVEVSMDADDGLRASDRTRLVGLDGSPDAALVTKERMDHLQGAFDELSDVHTRVLVMRELEGMSYREIGEKLDLTRPAVESALFRARRRLESEYERAFRGAPLRGDGGHDRAHRRRAPARHGGAAARAARAPLPQLPPPRARAWDRAAVGAGRAAPEGRGAAAAAVAAPPLRRRRRRDHWILRSGRGAAPLAERAAALVAVAALAGAGGAALGTGALPGDRDAAGQDRVAAERSAAGTGEQQRGATGAATDGERRGTRRASGRRDSGPAGGRAGEVRRAADGTERVRSRAPERAPRARTDGRPPGLRGSRPRTARVPGHGHSARRRGRALGAGAASGEVPRPRAAAPKCRAAAAPVAGPGHRRRHGRAASCPLSTLPLHSARVTCPPWPRNAAGRRSRTTRSSSRSWTRASTRWGPTSPTSTPSSSTR